MRQKINAANINVTIKFGLQLGTDNCIIFSLALKQVQLVAFFSVFTLKANDDT